LPAAYNVAGFDVEEGDLVVWVPGSLVDDIAVVLGPVPLPDNSPVLHLLLSA
jgi:hypothetical protein